MKFDYYYGSQADQFSFVRIPQIMLTGSAFRTLSIPAKVLYGVLLDRMSLSRKNQWFDSEQRVYIIYQICEIEQDLGFTKRKAMELLAELEDFGLLEKKRRGHGLPNILYVKSFMSGADLHEPMTGRPSPAKLGSGSAETGTSACLQPVARSTENRTLQVTKAATQEVQDFEGQEVQESALLMNHTDLNQSEMIQTKSNHIPSSQLATLAQAGYDAIRAQKQKEMSEVAAYESLIRENIGYDELLIAHRDDQELIEGIADLILETVLCRQDEMLIAGNQYPAQVVKSKFLKLNYLHIEYVLSCLRENTTQIRNIRKYILASLFNAPSTMEGYYQARVNHDMPQLAAGAVKGGAPC